MEGSRFRVVYLILVPAILVAAAILGYYTIRSSRDYAQLGEQTIAQSLLSVAEQRVERIEGYITVADHTVFRLVNPNDSSTLDTVWLPQAATQTPSVRSVLLLDPDGNIIQWASREDKKDRRAFLRVFRQYLLKSLELDGTEPNLLRHLHEHVDDRDYLLSYRAYATLAGQVTFIVAVHDTRYLVDEVFPTMFASDETTPLYNIVDESNQIVFGPDLSEAGVYTVDHRFPRTLYRWRLQVAPRQAARLQARGRSRMQGELTLPVMSFAIILLGAIFFIYSAEKERRLNQLKSELMANVSHELKTPLSVVRMFADMLRSGRVPSDARRLEYLDIICRESERLTSLIDNVLDFSALETSTPDGTPSGWALLNPGTFLGVTRRMASATQEARRRMTLAAARAQRLAGSATGFAHSLRGMGTGAMPPLFDSLGRLAMPALLAVGAEDAKFAAIARSLEGALPAARTLVVPEAGHAAHLERPAYVAGRVAEFLASVDLEASKPGSRARCP